MDAGSTWASAELNHNCLSWAVSPPNLVRDKAPMTCGFARDAVPVIRYIAWPARAILALSLRTGAVVDDFGATVDELTARVGE